MGNVNNSVYTLDNPTRLLRHSYDYVGAEAGSQSGPGTAAGPAAAVAALDSDFYVANTADAQQGQVVYSTPTQLQARGQRAGSSAREYEVENQPHRLDHNGYVAGADLERPMPPAAAQEARPRAGSVYAGFGEVDGGVQHGGGAASPC